MTRFARLGNLGSLVGRSLVGRRDRRLAAELRPPLEPDERIVAWAAPAEGEAVVATNRGLWFPGAETRIGWHEIHKVTWSGRVLTVVAAHEVAAHEVAAPEVAAPEAATGPGYAVMVDAAPVAVTLDVPGALPEQVRLRVNRSIGYTSHSPLPRAADGMGRAGGIGGVASGEGGVRVVARRVSGVDGLRWTVRYDQGVDSQSPEIAKATEELVRHAAQAVDAVAGPR